jgi:ADP-ribose pyrophosphatase YjhB (NUDIX family)
MRRWWHFAQTVIGVIFRHPIPGVSIIPILSDGSIVLVRRLDNGKWSLPGGLVNWGEDIETTIYRELEEETGLQVTKIGRLIGVYSSPERDGRMHSICVAIAVEVEGTPHVQDKMEVADVRAFTLDTIPMGTLSHDHDRQLQDYFDGVTKLA